MIRCVAFDFDGTLVRSNAIKQQAFYEVVGDVEGGICAIRRIFEDGIEGNRYRLFAELARRLGRKRPEDFTLTLAARYSDLCRRLIAVCDEIPGARTTLEMLFGRGLPLYLVSATPETDLLPIVEERKLTALFRRIHGGPTTKASLLAGIIADEAIDPHELAMVGDRDDDRAAAEAVGCHFIAVTADVDDAPVEAVYQLADLAALPALLSGLSAVLPAPIGAPDRVGGS